MKRVRCPKCNNYITFDETRYTPGQTLVFECPDCRRQFGIRIGTSTLLQTHKDERKALAGSQPTSQSTPNTPNPQNTPNTQNTQNPPITPNPPISPSSQFDCGSIIVVENVFHYRQQLPLQLGDNVLGRYVHGTSINTPIETVDPSVDTTHCVINVRRDRMGQFIYTLRDASTDGTGTFVGNTFLRPQDRLRIDHGTVITIGATTLILKAAGQADEETTAEPKAPNAKQR